METRTPRKKANTLSGWAHHTSIPSVTMIVTWTVASITVGTDRHRNSNTIRNTAKR
jgi:hypothetical protein